MMSALMLKKLRFNLAYYHNPPWDKGITPPELIDFVKTHAPGTALDLGCGTGTNTVYLAQKGWKATGIDYSWRAIQIARKRAHRFGLDVDLQLGDVTRLDHWSGKYDLILDIGCLHNLSDQGRQVYLNQVKLLLAPEGTFLVYLILRRESGDPGHGMLESHLSELTQMFTLHQRVDSTHNGNRLSAWLTFHSAP
jgi:SAM-dependent methyltransferase